MRLDLRSDEFLAQRERILDQVGPQGGTLIASRRVDHRAQPALQHRALVGDPCRAFDAGAHPPCRASRAYGSRQGSDGGADAEQEKRQRTEVESACDDQYGGAKDEGEPAEQPMLQGQSVEPGTNRSYLAQDEPRFLLAL